MDISGIENVGDQLNQNMEVGGDLETYIDRAVNDTTV